MVIFKNWLLGKYDKPNYFIAALLMALSIANKYFFLLFLLFAITSTIANDNLNIVIVLYFVMCLLYRLFQFNIYRVLIVYLLLVLIIKCGIKIHKRHIKVSAITFAVAVLYIIYICLDFGFRKNSAYHCLIEALSIIAIILCFYNRDDFDFVTLSIAFVMIFICGSVLSIFYVEPYYEYRLADDIGSLRFTGISLHPNVTAEICIFLLALILTLKFCDKISDYTFGILFSALYPIGLLTLSRIFRLFLIVVFFVFYFTMIIKRSLNNGNHYRFLLWFSALIVLLSCLFGSQFMDTMLRSDVEMNALLKLRELQDPEMFTAVMNGEIAFDPERLGIWLLYGIAICTSYKTVFLGHGNFAPWIGKLHSHNFLIFYVYKYGLIGFAILAAIFILLFLQLKKKSLMEFIRDNFGIIFVVLGFYIFALLNNNELDILPYCMFFIFFGSKMRPRVNLAGNLLNQQTMSRGSYF